MRQASWLACRDLDFAASVFDCLFKGGSSRNLWLVSTSPVLSDSIQKKPANQLTITALPLHVPPQIALWNSNIS
jgi:hypothetical protein